MDRGAFTGKLPKEFIDRVYDDIEELKKRIKEAEGFNLQVPYLVELGMDEPFLGSLSRYISKIPTLYIPTAGVNVNESRRISYFYNPVFMHEMEKEDPKFIYGINKHELYHICFEHCTTRRREPHVLWNIATDLAINSLIPRKELPSFVLVPGELHTPKNPPKDFKHSLIATIIAKLPLEKSSDWYMEELLSNPEIKNAMARAQAGVKKKLGQGQKSQNKDGSQDGQPASEGSEGGEDEQSTDTEFSKNLRKELFGDQGGQFDDHEAWDDIADADRDFLRDMMRDVLRDCIKDAERSNRWGSVPGSMQSHLKKIISNEVDWRDVLNNFIGRSRATTSTSSFKRMSRRCPWEFPGRKRSYTVKCAAAVDESGSMSDTWIALLFAELSNLGNVSEFDILPFSTVVNEKGIQTCSRSNPPKFIRTDCGGTDFNAPVKYINEKRHEGKSYDLLLILTDGCCSKPEKCEIPIAYILAPGCKLEFEPDPMNIVIQMTDTR